MTAGRDWVRTAAFAVLIGSAVVLSYSTLRDVALSAGFAPWAAWLYPPAIDATILVAARTSRDAELSRRTRVTAAAVTLLSIAAGVAAFVAQHAQHGPAGVGFAVVVPLALAAALVLTSWSATDRREAAVEAARAAEQQRERQQARQAKQHAKSPASPKPGDASPPASPTRVSPTARSDRDEWVRQQLAAGVEVTGGDVDRRFGGRGNGHRVVKRVKAEQNGHPS